MIIGGIPMNTPLLKKPWFINPGLTLLHVGVSENSVPLNPMVNDPYPY